MIRDIVLTLLILVIAFGLVCWIAWREGKPLSAKSHKALRVVPYVGLLFAVYFATYVIWPPAGYEHPFVQRQLAGDAAFALIAAGLAAVYVRIAPAIYAAGAVHHPAPVIQRTAQEIHLRRRTWNAAQRRALPLYAIGLGVAALALLHGVEIRNGAWVAFSFLGAQSWLLLVVLAVRRVAKKAAGPQDK